MALLEFQANAREVRNRLRNPQNGRKSSELEIISEVGFRQRRWEERRALQEAERAQAERDRAAALREAIARAAEDARRKAFEDLQAQGYAPPRPALPQILSAVCNRYRVSELEIRSKRRTAYIVLPRHVLMYLCRNLTELSLPGIGRRLGGRDHTTVLSGIRKIERLIQEGDNYLEAEIEDITRSLGAA